ncbi:F-type H+-transporting ATPase subunit b [Rhodobium orientis]|uniref:ATP synthase subunit b n=1 Tax=Rhodobium orientis TaxID=34017 RepID=A0A327JHI6_9HYPH|nr:ATP F0F1 synthase subunit B [Rhodobium orientis]MBB4305638.1 F-type H+-transporting ATPase subunit b [Rhodobium orientis]MBK5949152.1 ATP F0F1 synthase subunit B [Rhodobium orientis]RAI24784.1 ATP F0F1 synthase subunit B [Rhodobium orientis]
MDATFWALVALILFFIVIFWVKVPGKIGASLDARAERIQKELDEARRLREEAQALLADYQRKRREAEQEAEDIIAEAKAEAERLTAVTNKSLEEMIERRTKSAEVKITQAEAQAVAAVRARAADVAIAAAEQILAEKVSGDAAKQMIETSIKDVAANLN